MGVYRELRKGPISIGGVEFPVNGGDIALDAAADITVTPNPAARRIEIGRDTTPRPLSVAGIEFPAEGGDIAVEAADDIRVDVDPAARTISVGRNVVQEGTWQPVVLQNGWGEFGGGFSPVAFYKSADGIVRMRGLVLGGTFGHDATGIIFTLPATFRPPYRQLFGCLSGDDVAVPPVRTSARVDVFANGEVHAIEGYNGWITLDQVAFRTT